MAQIIYAEQALNDLERIFDFLAEKDAAQATEAALLIREAIKVLERHPLIGRHAEHGRRELIISRGRSGYVALYKYLEGDEAGAHLGYSTPEGGGLSASVAMKQELIATPMSSAATRSCWLIFGSMSRIGDSGDENRNAGCRFRRG